MKNSNYPQFESLSSSTPEDHTNDDKKSFPCTFPGCGKIFKFKSEIKRHSVIHFENRPFPCPHESCKKTFKRADALETHMRLHLKDEPFNCDFPDCDKKFTTKAALKYHLLKHKQERSFKCDFPGCDKSFFTKGQLKQHEKAFNFHFNLTPKVREETKKTAVAIINNDDKDSLQKFSPPEPRLVQDTEWEIKNLGLEAFDKEEQHSTTSYENIVKYVFKENADTNDKIEKLELGAPMNFQDEDRLVFGLDKGPEWLHPVQEPSLFFDPNEFQILDFLKEQAYDDYWNTDFTSGV